MTGRPPIPKRSLLKCFLLKIYFSIDSLRQLVDTLDQLAISDVFVNLTRFPIFLHFYALVHGFKNKDFLHFMLNFSKLGVRYPKLAIMTVQRFEAVLMTLRLDGESSLSIIDLKVINYIFVQRQRESFYLMSSQSLSAMPLPLRPNYFHL